MQLPLRPPYELVEEQAFSGPTLHMELQERLDSRTMPTCYTSRPVVESSNTPVLAFAIYTDGRPYSNTDTVIGMWSVCALAASRSFIGLLRKRVLCTCGCRDRCTFFLIMSWLRWAIGVMASGVYLAARHDGSAFQASEGFRQSLAGSKLKFRCMTSYSKEIGLSLQRGSGTPPIRVL